VDESLSEEPELESALRGYRPEGAKDFRRGVVYGWRRASRRSNTSHRVVLFLATVLGTISLAGVVGLALGAVTIHGNSPVNHQYEKPGCGFGDKNHNHSGPPGKMEKGGFVPGTHPNETSGLYECPANAGGNSGKP
jgi:hypothetical protein